MDSWKEITFMTFAARSALLFIIGYACYGMYRIWINGSRYTKATPDSVNKVAIITGASHGIGKKVAHNLAERGVHVILACRNENDGIQTQNEIIASTGNPNVQYIHLDLSSFKSIRTFAKQFLSTGTRLDVLINNTNILRYQRELSEDGLEKTIAVNHFGPFLLTMLLMKRLSQTIPSRIINVSHWLHRRYDIDQTDLMNQNRFDAYKVYAQSQLARVYFTFALSQRLLSTGTTCNVIHPGVSVHSLIDRLSLSDNLKNVLAMIANTIFKTEDACAEGIVFAALDFSIQNVSGLYLSGAQIGECGQNALNKEMGEWIWRESEEITGIKFDKSTLDLYNPFK